MTTINIKVKQDHIDNAAQGNPEACMVWDALQTPLDLPDSVRCRVLYDSISFHRKGPKGGVGKVVVRAILPPSISAKIKAWDISKKAVNPFDFDLNLPDDWREQLKG